MSQGTITNVLNMGYIHAPKYVGGIMAWFNKGADVEMMNSAVNVGMLDYGDVDGAGTIGNFVGKLYKNGTLANCYYDRQLSIYNATHSAAIDGGNAITTAELTAGTPLEGLDTAYWTFEAGKYPILKTFADEAGAMAGAMSVVYFDENARCDTIKHDCPLYQADGLTWAVASASSSNQGPKRAIPIGTGSAFQIKNESLWMDPAVTLTDTVVATYEGFTKRIPVMAQPDTVPTPEICNDEATLWFEDELADVTFYYTDDSTEPNLESWTLTGNERTGLPDGTYEIIVIGTKHNYYPSNPVSKIVTLSDVTDLLAGKEVAKREYFNANGMKSDEPIDGINIIVTTFTDGTRVVTKVIR